MGNYTPIGIRQYLKTLLGHSLCNKDNSSARTNIAIVKRSGG
jgi:hypothetical protein